MPDIFGQGDIDIATVTSGISTAQAIAYGIGAVVMSFIGGTLLSWRQFAKTRSAVAEDAAATKKLAMELGWMERQIKENADNEVLIDKLRGIIDTLREEGVVKDRRNERLEAEKVALADRTMAAEAERERVIDEMHEKGAKVGACEERVRLQAEQLIDLRLANGFLFAELAATNRPAAERLLTEHLKPVRRTPGPPPPPVPPPEGTEQ